MKSRSNSLSRNIVSQYLLQIARYIFPFVSLPYLTRVLGPDSYAIRSYVLSVMTFAQTLLEFGFTKYGTKRLIDCRSSAEKVNRCFSEINAAKILIITGTSILMIFIIESVPQLSANLGFTILSYTAIVVNAFLPDFVFQGFEQMSSITKRYVLAKAISTSLIFVLVHSSSDLILVPLCDLAGNGVAVAWSQAYVYRHYNIRIRKVKFIDAARSLRVSARYFSIEFSSTILNSFSVLIVGQLNISSADLSVWSLSLTAINAVQSLYTPITNSLYPNIVATHNYRNVLRVILFAMPVLVAGLLVIELFATNIVAIVAGEVYAGSGWVLSMLAPIIFFSFFGALLKWPVLGASGHIKELSVGVYVSAAVLVTSLSVSFVTGTCSIIIVAAIRVIVEAVSTSILLFYCYKYREELLRH